jgi:hypothetical protein
MVVFAGQPRTVVQGDEHFETNVVIYAGDNHRGCYECQSILHGARGQTYPIGHPISHLREPFIPPTERWSISNRVEFAVLRVQYRGKEFWLTNEIRVLKSKTNLFRMQFVPVELPPSMLP